VAGKIEPISIQQPSKPLGEVSLRLIGTIGNRAVLLPPEGSAKTAATGEELTVDGVTVKVVAVLPKSAIIRVDGKRKELTLGAAPELVAKAAAEEVKADKNAMNAMKTPAVPVTAGSVTTGSNAPPPVAALPSATAIPTAAAVKSATNSPNVTTP
jgi:hypothetical protein